MLQFLLGLEKSAPKSFLYVLFTGSIIVMAFSALYLTLVGGPMAINKAINHSNKA